MSIEKTATPETVRIWRMVEYGITLANEGLVDRDYAEEALNVYMDRIERNLRIMFPETRNGK